MRRDDGDITREQAFSRCTEGRKGGNESIQDMMHDRADEKDKDSNKVIDRSGTSNQLTN